LAEVLPRRALRKNASPKEVSDFINDALKRHQDPRHQANCRASEHRSNQHLPGVAYMKLESGHVIAEFADGKHTFKGWKKFIESVPG
jgi:hypothetical protein